MLRRALREGQVGGLPAAQVLGARAGLRPSGWLAPKLYEPDAWVSATRDAPLDGSLMRRLASLDPEARAEVAELREPARREGQQQRT